MEFMEAVFKRGSACMNSLEQTLAILRKKCSANIGGNRLTELYNVVEAAGGVVNARVENVKEPSEQTQANLNLAILVLSEALIDLRVLIGEKYPER